jgi:hypothetical protein
VWHAKSFFFFWSGAAGGDRFSTVGSFELFHITVHWQTTTVGSFSHLNTSLHLHFLRCILEDFSLVCLICAQKKSESAVIAAFKLGAAFCCARRVDFDSLPSVRDQKPSESSDNTLIISRVDSLAFKLGAASCCACCVAFDSLPGVSDQKPSESSENTLIRSRVDSLADFRRLRRPFSGEPFRFDLVRFFVVTTDLRSPFLCAVYHRAMHVSHRVQHAGGMTTLTSYLLL